MEIFRLRLCAYLDKVEILSRVLEMRMGDVFVVGSHSSCDLALDYPTISRKHARIQFTDGVLYAEDLGSKNGTELGGALLSESTSWQEKAPLKLGPYVLEWSTEDLGLKTEADFSREILQGFLSKTDDVEKEKWTPEALSRQIDAALEQKKVFRGDRTKIRERLLSELLGDGPVTEYLLNKNTREILVNGFDKLYADTGEGLLPCSDVFLTEKTYLQWILRTAAQAGRRIDYQSPICEATLPDGSRFQAVLPPIAHGAPIVAIRRFSSAPRTEEEILRSGFADVETIAKLKGLVEKRANIVVSGGTSSGKTTLLNFLCRYLGDQERIVTVEDTVELDPPVKNLVQLQARKANSDSIGTVSLRHLVQASLRLRPDRVIVGECRGAEVLEMLQAMNTGHPGSMTTIHANSARDALRRIELLALLESPSISREALSEWIKSSIDCVVQLERDETGKRRVSEIAEVQCL